MKTNIFKTLLSAIITPIASNGIIIWIVVILVGYIGAAFIFPTLNPIKWFSDNNLKIEDTKNIVEEIRNISELTTCCFYNEYVLKSNKDRVENKEGWFGIKYESREKRELVFVVKGSVRAGFNFSKIKEEDIKVNKDTINIKLPKPEIFDVISNPSDYKIITEEGKWDHEEVVALQSEGKKLTLNKALKGDIFSKTNTAGKEHITNLLKAFGFNVVNVTLTEVSTDETM